MISYDENINGETWAIILNERGEMVGRLRRAPFKKVPADGFSALTAAKQECDSSESEKQSDPKAA